MKKIVIIKSQIFFWFAFVIAMNYIANALPLNNRSTGAISDIYPSLFTPAGFTFSIWGLIYVLLGVVVYQLLMKRNSDFFSEYPLFFCILFLVTCVTNITWLFAWHYDNIGLSSVIMLVFMLALFTIVFQMKDLSYFTKIAFSVYAGWISIAFIANISILLVKLNIPLFQNNAISWYVVIMIIGVIIGLLVMLLTKNLIFVLVYIWAYFGIYMKHFQQVGAYLPRSYNVFNLFLWVILAVSWMIIWINNHYKVLN